MAITTERIDAGWPPPQRVGDGILCGSVLLFAPPPELVFSSEI